jgi:antitoxin component of RelBE/YafQ-DinJ toxin-antitoxin module
MIKEKDILIRIDSKLKEQVKQIALNKGLSLSAFIRTLIMREVNGG